MKTLALTVAVGSLAFASAAGAEDADSLNWPLQSFFLQDVPQVQEKGAVQVQSGARLRNEGDQSEWEVPSELEVGVSDKLQLNAEVPWARQHQQGLVDSGVRDVEVGTDYKLADSRDSGFGASIGLGVQAPTGARVARDESYEVSPRLRAFKQLGVVGLNLTAEPGVSIDPDSRDLSPQLRTGAGLSFGQGAFVPTLEGHAQFGDETRLEGSAGVRLKPAKPLELGVAAIGGTKDGERVYGGAVDLLIDIGG